MPGGSGDGNSFGPQDIAKVKSVLEIPKCDLRWESADQAVEREHEFVKKYDEDLAPRRKERIENDKERNKRKNIVQSEILVENELREKELMRIRDEQFAQQLKSEQLEQLEK